VSRAALVITALLFTGLAYAESVDAPPLSPSLSPTLREARAAADKGDFATALKLLRAEADHGNADAANGLGEMLLAGHGGKAVLVEAAKYFQQAVEMAHPAAAFNLATLLEQGAEGISKDEDKARFLLQTAAEGGYAPAQFRIGSKLEPPPERGEEKEGFIEAHRWYEKAAAQNHPDALLALVRFYDSGLGGVVPDHAKATMLCIQAAKSGSVAAMNDMGVRYQNGTGIQKDNVAAIGWFVLATQYHLPTAEVNLGNCYETANGVRQDFDQAGSHYAAAARQNYAPAQFLLAQLFESGKGTAVNLVNAYVLFARAADGNLTGAGARRDAVKLKLNAVQLAEAEKMLAENPERQDVPGLSHK
jgi:TPR repeat protein